MKQTLQISKARRIAHRIFRYGMRMILVVVTAAVLLFVGLCVILNTVFNGPSVAARDILTMTMLESSGMKWCPALFIGEETVAQIQAGANLTLPGEISTSDQVEIRPMDAVTASEWADYPDGIRIDEVVGDSYNAYVMLIRDPSAVYMAVSADRFDMSIPGERINRQIVKEGAIAAINAGAFYDNGKATAQVGSVPQGLVVADGTVRWTKGKAPQNGFVGFNEDDVLVVAQSMTAEQAMELKIRDGCCFGPVLIMDGNINEEAYNANSGWNPRTAIGQRGDGTVIFVCIDGRQAGSLGADYGDIIDIMTEYGAVNACNLDGGSSTVMLYKDTYGRYGAAGEICMINNYSLLQEAPRRMPTFFMVRPEK